MECKQARAMLGPYLEELLSSEEKRLVEEHLVSCARCRDALEDLQRTAGLLRNLEEVEPPPWFTQKVMARVREEAEKKKAGILERLFFPLRVKVPIQALATALIVVLALYVYRAVEPETRLAQAPPETARVITKNEVGEQPNKAGSTAAPKAQAVPGERHLEHTERPVGAAREDSIGTLEKEGAPPAPGIEAERAKEKKSETIADGTDREMKAAAPSRSPEVVQGQKPVAPAPAPAAVSESAGSARSTGARPSDTREQKALAPAPETRSFAARETAPLTFTVRVGDMRTASKDIEQLLARLGGRSITVESREDKASIAAELPSDRVDELVRRLNSFGQVREKGARPAGPEGTIPIRIEVSTRP